MRPLISIIVPVYKVEKYLKECIESILAQTYKELEIILVNDGSPDNCGKICDFYANMDNRIRVIHKENGGLSSARNAGIDICNGEYISFIDSDDFVSPYFIEIFYKGVELNDSDIVSYTWPLNFIDGLENNINFTNNENVYKISEIDPLEAIHQLLYQKIPNGAQHRLYKREILEGIRFPLGYLFEDVATVYKTFIKAKKMTLIKADVYAYRIRENSIVRMKFSNAKMISIPISIKLFEEICDYNPKLKKAAASRSFAINYQVFLQVPHDNKEKKKQLWNEMKKYRGMILRDFNLNVRLKNRAGAFATLLGMNIAYKLGIFFLYKQKRTK